MAFLMSIADYASNQKATQVRGDFHVGVLVKVLNQAKADGQAAQKLIASAAPVRRSQEPGKGSLVGLTA